MKRTVWFLEDERTGKNVVLVLSIPVTRNRAEVILKVKTKEGYRD